MLVFLSAYHHDEIIIIIIIIIRNILIIHSKVRKPRKKVTMTMLQQCCNNHYLTLLSHILFGIWIKTLNQGLVWVKNNSGKSSRQGQFHTLLSINFICAHEIAGLKFSWQKPRPNNKLYFFCHPYKYVPFLRLMPERSWLRLFAIWFSHFVA